MHHFTFVGGAAGRRAEPELSDQTSWMQRKMKDLEKEKDGGNRKAGRTKENDQVCSIHSD